MHPNLINLLAVARAVKPLGQDVVFVGGATTLLYADDPELGETRATEDVDCVVELATLREYHQIEDRLRALGFKNAHGPGTPICRWKLASLVVDVMPTKEALLGFSNRWYEPGFKARQAVKVPGTDETVLVFSAPYFLASKIEALFDRGIKDLVISQDFEDVVFLLDRRVGLLGELSSVGEDVRAYLVEKIAALLTNSNFEQALAGQYPRVEMRARRDLARELFAKMTRL